MNFMPELPLLRRELTELANRRRTYVVRVVAATVILLLVFIAYQNGVLQRQRFNENFNLSGPTQFLGIGGDVFLEVGLVLFVAITILMPALACGSVASEKEANTLGTLLLTRLTPGVIILEKFGSRLVPMLTFLLLTFPVLAQVHSLGGVDTQLLAGTLWLLLCHCFLIASVAIFCSAWFPGTTSAFIWSYMIVGFFAVQVLIFGDSSFLPPSIWMKQFAGTSFSNNPWNTPATPTAFQWIWVVAASIPSLFFTCLFLVMARFALVHRAFASSSSLLLKIFKRVDVFFKNLNERTTGGIELVKDTDTPPEDAPVAWREQNKKSLGKARYLFRVLIVVELPVLFCCVVAATNTAETASGGLQTLLTITWILSGITAAFKGATLLSSERARQTLEPLLASPISTVDIIDQKIRGMKRLIIVLAIPALTVNLTHFLLRVDPRAISNLSSKPLLYLVMSIPSTFILLYLIAWFSAGIGIRFHSQARSVLIAIGLLATWAIGPLIISRMTPGAAPSPIEFLSPFAAVEFLEDFLTPVRNNTSIITRHPLPAIFLNTVAFVLIRFVVRHCAPGLLSRRDNLSRDTTPPIQQQITQPEGSQS